MAEDFDYSKNHKKSKIHKWKVSDSEEQKTDFFQLGTKTDIHVSPFQVD